MIINKVTESVEASLKYKYNEDAYIAEIKEYVDSTYQEHYSSNKYQATEFIIDSGHGTGFCIGNIMKYAQRYGRKGDRAAWRKDLLKVIHYALIELHVHDQEHMLTEHELKLIREETKMGEAKSCIETPHDLKRTDQKGKGALGYTIKGLVDGTEEYRMKAIIDTEKLGDELGITSKDNFKINIEDKTCWGLHHYDLKLRENAEWFISYLVRLVKQRANEAWE